jgi:hypothetical protein
MNKRSYPHPDSYDKLRAHLGDKIGSMYSGRVYDVVDGETKLRNREISIEDANDLLDDELAFILRRNDCPFPPSKWEEIDE